MKHNHKFLQLIIIISLWACTGPITVPELPSQSDPGTLVLEKAETLFRQQSFEDALEAYSQYLRRFPNGTSADLALKRMASIYGYRADQAAKLETCRRLVSEYPDSPYAPAANFEIMMALYSGGKSREVILRASAIIKKSDDKDLLVPTYMIIGDTYISLGSPADAVFFYNAAYSKADPSQKEHIIKKLTSVVGLLSRNDVTLLSRHLDRDSLKSHLLYLLASMEYERENYAEAKKGFLEFVEAFPQNQAVEQANLLILEIDQKTAFRRERIGCMLPLSGPYEAFGNRALKAIQLALDRVRSPSGKPEWQLVVRDTESDPDTVARVVQELDERRVALIIGPMVTGKIAAMEAQKRKIPILTLTQQTGIPEIGEYVFRNFLTPDLQVETLLAYAIDKFGARRFAILYPDETYGKTYMKLFRDRAIYYGANVVGVASYAPTQTDFSLPIKRLAKIPKDREERVSAPHRWKYAGKAGHFPLKPVALDFDAIFIPDEPSKVELIAPQLAYWDVNHVLLMGTNLWHSDRLIANARNYVQDAILVDAFYAQTDRREVQIFIRSFEELYGQPPGPIEGLAYDTAMIAFQTAAHPEVRSRKDLKDRLKQTSNYEGTTGLTSFNANGDVQKELYLLQIKGRKFIELD
jgi:branched-chain amino acid transport system substrate-binding protein